MFLKSLASILIVTSGFVLAIGQTPEAKQEKEKVARTFAFTFDGDGGYLGVQTAEVDRDNYAKYGLRDVRGVAVEKVVEGSPAAAAGIREGDVILRLNGEEITSTRKLSRLISEVAPDHQVKVTISRSGTEQDVKATLGKRPAPRFGEGNFTWTSPEGMKEFEFDKLKDLPRLKDFPKGEMPKVFTTPDGEGRAFAWRAGEGRQIGVGVMQLGKQLAEHFGVQNGVLIDNVREASPAAKAGLKAGDIITEIDGKAVNGQFDLIRGINEKKEGDVTLTIVRDRNRQTISVTPERGKGSGFVFQTEDDNDGLFTPLPPSLPSDMKIAPPPMQAMPALAPGAMTFVHPRPVI